LADICNLDTEKVFAVFSENMSPKEYIALAKKIGEEIQNGIDGIVIGHGTDTLAHTAAADLHVPEPACADCAWSARSVLPTVRHPTPP
jgi:L-asparaginase/archaeal Glu-tRNAGln amidotransferase subunit D